MICLAIRASISSIVGAAGGDGVGRARRPWRRAPPRGAIAEIGGADLAATAGDGRGVVPGGGVGLAAAAVARVVLLGDRLALRAAARSGPWAGRPTCTSCRRRRPGRGCSGSGPPSISCLRVLATSSRLTPSSSASRRSDQSWCSRSLTSTARRRSARVSGRPWNRLTPATKSSASANVPGADLGRDRLAAEHHRRRVAVEAVGQEPAARRPRRPSPAASAPTPRRSARP